MIKNEEETRGARLLRIFVFLMSHYNNRYTIPEIMHFLSLEPEHLRNVQRDLLALVSIEGEYVKRISRDKFITIRYSKLYKWEYEIRNCESHILMSADCQDAISIDSLQKMLDLAGIELKLNRGEDEKDWTTLT